MTVRKVRRGDTVYEMDVAGRDTPANATMRPVPAIALASDPLGIPVPETQANVFASLADFHEAKNLFDHLAGLLDRIAQGPGGDAYRQEMVRTAGDGPPGYACPALRIARAKLAAAEPYCCYCPACQRAYSGRAHPACKACGGRGWTTRAAFESCTPSDRQRILGMRTLNG
jgi:hypothetical protein